MGRLYQQLLLVSSAAMMAVVVVTPSAAQDTHTVISKRITTARQYKHLGNQQAALRSDGVRTVRHTVPGEYTVTGDPEVISPGSVAQSAGSVGESYVEDTACCDSGCGSQGCRSRGCGRRRNRQTEGAADPWYNCSCNGSYKFPVPPLYTYHWPGMFSQELMTNYHSPWRFPPLRPYEDEPTPIEDDEPQASYSPAYLPVGHSSPSTRHGYEPYSAKIERYYSTLR